MTAILLEFLKLNHNLFTPLANTISVDDYCEIDLSQSNQELNGVEITNPIACQSYIESVLNKNHAKVAFGGYLECRNLYSDKSNFSKAEGERNIHLGIDFWSAAGTKVHTPLKGNVHSFKNNSSIGDYGPTIILIHEINGFVFHTLYGHLSLSSIDKLEIGQEIEAGETIGALGTSDINVNYAPHLHFQLIIDMEGKFGDYPGVCSIDTLEFYRQNCPNPSILLPKMLQNPR